MPIDSETLATWTHYDSGPIKTAEDTHTHIRNNLEDDDSRLNDRGKMRFGTLLYGSYANYTIIHGTSDVDVLVRMDNPYNGDLSNLPKRLQDRYKNEATYFSGDYSIENFQQDVLNELKNIYGANAVERQEKAIVIDSDNCQLSLDADVLPCQQYRRYKSFNGDQHDEDTYYQGVRFLTTDGTAITSFPKRHMKNGAEMNEACNENYKATIRIFKNARDCLIRRDRIDEGDVPSYFVECLLYNVSADKFHTSDLQQRYVGIVNALGGASFSGFTAQNGIENLFGNDETQWSMREADTFVKNLAWLWESGFNSIAAHDTH